MRSMPLCAVVIPRALQSFPGPESSRDGAASGALGRAQQDRFGHAARAA